VANGFSIKKLLRVGLLKWVYKHIDFALSPGSASDAYFKRAGLTASQIIRAPHAVDNDTFAAGHEEKEREAVYWRSQLGIADDHNVFLFAGKLEPKKNPILLINAFIELSKFRKDIHLIIVGNGILEDELKRLASTLQPFNPSTLQSFNPSTLSTPSTVFPNFTP